MQPVVLVAAAGRVDLPRVRLLAAVSLGGLLAGGLVVGRLAPEIINRRGEKKWGALWWDRLFLLTYSFLAFLLVLAAGLDIGRLHGSTMDPHFAVIGVVLHVSAAALFAWAMVTNPHFEMMARIQKERNHRVVTTGPYRIVRHPGYVAGASLSLSVPLIVGSFFALIPACGIVILYVARAELEDRLLRRDLDGYQAYADRVRYRLLPFVR
jgi:protein-S-isoprenylcysteine O-methyltransferase Ste14